ncbi:MAG: hypothetical protein OQK12_05065 [Motiliproteus sp.]|nr:hypothetical protein [Motiliproteus sp.]
MLTSGVSLVLVYAACLKCGLGHRPRVAEKERHFSLFGSDAVANISKTLQRFHDGVIGKIGVTGVSA